MFAGGLGMAVPRRTTKKTIAPAASCNSMRHVKDLVDVAALGEVDASRFPSKWVCLQTSIAYSSAEYGWTPAAMAYGLSSDCA
jgi:hypothetical protein